MSADLSRNTADRPRPTDPHATYTERLSQRERQFRHWTQRDRVIGHARLILFLAGCGVAWFVLRPGTLSWGWLLPFVAGFAGLVLYHERVKHRRLRAGRSVAFYTQGLARLEDRWVERGEPGENFCKRVSRLVIPMQLISTCLVRGRCLPYCAPRGPRVDDGPWRPG